MPVSNLFTVNNLGFWHFHGVEEVVGSIPTIRKLAIWRASFLPS
jgi:hypothetical protein